MKRGRSPSRLIVFVIVVVAVLAFGSILFANGKKWYDRYRQGKEIATLEREIAQLKKEQEEQQQFLQVLQSPFFIEREGREKFGVKKPGETVVLFPVSEEEGNGFLSTKKQQHEPPFFREWFQYFFKPDNP